MHYIAGVTFLESVGTAVRAQRERRGLHGEDSAAPARKPIALLDVHGAGKSTIGAALAKKLAKKLDRHFVELDRELETATGLSLGDVFTLHGEAYYRRVEREVLTRILADTTPTVLATGGSIVNDPTTFSLLRSRAQTIFLHAKPEDHWNRVVAQGDQRPMAENPHEALRAPIAPSRRVAARRSKSSPRSPTHSKVRSPGHTCASRWTDGG